MIRLSVLCMLFFCLFSCAPKQTKVILLPQEGEPTGSVLVGNKQGVATLDKPYTFISAKQPTKGMAVETADPDEINRQYAGLFAAEFSRKNLRKKPKPEPGPFYARVTLYFESGNTILTEDSHFRVSGLLKLILENAPCDITIVGYTDTIGNADENMLLSMRRAEKAAYLLKPVNSSIRHLHIKGFGEYGLQVHTPDNTDEPMNRRVRITIH